MSKLFAPILDSKLQVSFYIDSSDKLRIKIPYREPLGVGWDEYEGYLKCIIKDVQDNSIIKDVFIGPCSNNIINLSIEKDKYTVGNYYKIQIAFVSNYNDEAHREVGSFSNVGVFRYIPITNVDLAITFNKGLQFTTTIGFPSIITDKCEEKILKSIYEISLNGQIISKQEIIGNVNSFILKTINRYVKSVNKLTIKYQCYTVSNIYYTNTFSFEPFTITVKSENLTGQKCFEYNPNQANISFNTGLIEGCVCKIDTSSSILYFLDDCESVSQKKDYNIEQGVVYKYGIVSYSGTSTTNQILSLQGLEAISCDFEDILIYDGVKQLRLAYNPKVSSYKTNLLETKTNTIGGKYPFIFRNGDVNYKEFQISGLLSANLDQDNQFIDEKLVEEPVRRRTAAADLPGNWVSSRTNLTAENIYRERQFKTNVYDWLTNGEVKLLRTPTEGNFLVRFINVSMTPNDQLSRMLHTVNMTAVEIDECTNENMRKYGLM